MLLLPRLIYLDISCNLIADLEALGTLPALRTLIISYNLVKDIQPICKMRSLLEIDIEHNLIDSVENLLPLIQSDIQVFICAKNPASR